MPVKAQFSLRYTFRLVKQEISGQSSLQGNQPHPPERSRPPTPRSAAANCALCSACCCTAAAAAAADLTRGMSDAARERSRYKDAIHAAITFNFARARGCRCAGTAKVQRIV
jgi:hypothetical protein